MTATDRYVAPRCPRCDSDIVVTMSTGALFCPSCQHEWEATSGVELSATPESAGEGEAHAPASAPPSPAAEVDLAESIAAARAVYLSAQVRLNDDDEWHRVVAILDNGDVVLADRDGLSLIVDMDDVDWASSGRAIAAVDDEVAQVMGATTLTVAALCLQAGLGSIGEADGATVLIASPGGWLPQDADAWPILEQGVAYAVATLIHLFRLDRDQIARVIEQYTIDAQASGGQDQ